jgi:hypothetical protein
MIFLLCLMIYQFFQTHFKNELRNNLQNQTYICDINECIEMMHYKFSM